MGDVEAQASDGSPPPPPSRQDSPGEEGILAEHVAAELAPPPFGPAVFVFFFITAATFASSLGCLLSLSTLAVLTFQLDSNNVWRLGLETYAVALAFFTVLLEFPWIAPKLTTCCLAFDYWIGRGALQLLVALLTKAEVIFQSARATHGGTDISNRTLLGVALLVGNISVLALVGCAVVHIVGGLFCAEHLEGYVLRRRDRHQQLLGELRDLERRRPELTQNLLQRRQQPTSGTRNET